MNTDVIKQFHSFTDTKPIQIVDEEKKRSVSARKKK